MYAKKYIDIYIYIYIYTNSVHAWQYSDAKRIMLWTLCVFSMKERKHLHVLLSKTVRGSGTLSSMLANTDLV